MRIITPQLNPQLLLGGHHNRCYLEIPLAHGSKPTKGRSPHTLDPIVVESVRRLHEMIVDAGMENRIELMEDGGLNAGNVAEFVEVGMTVGEFSSPLLKGPDGKLAPGSGLIEQAVKKLRAVLEIASRKFRNDNGLIKS